ncbi:hypothetical protein [Amycolatopsis sp.]|uniref:hypothetical protein n=1 Tax=Amycolatopsis sp. TaxID=37632 RepID=UPI002E043297|nr:hypothetical protein [Amycolatopsis sp.]
MTVSAVLAAVLSIALPATGSASVPVPCTPPGPSAGQETQLILVSTNSSTCTVLRLIAKLNLGSEAQGHFQFFGPFGPIATSPDKFWSSGEQYRYDVNQVTGGNHLWCVDFWMPSGGGWVRHGEPNCVGF